jgi:hypothetical protein
MVWRRIPEKPHAVVRTEEFQKQAKAICPLLCVVGHTNKLIKHPKGSHAAGTIAVKAGSLVYGQLDIEDTFKLASRNRFIRAIDVKLTGDPSKMWSRRREKIMTSSK